MSENYPSDMRQYDNDPRSPYYVDPDEWMEDKANEIAAEWYSEFVIGGRVDELDWDTAEIKFLMAGHSVDALTLLRNKAFDMIHANPEQYQIEPDYSEY